MTGASDGAIARTSRTRYVAVRDADHGRAVLRFLFEYGALAPAIGDDALPWRLSLRRDAIEIHAANAIASGRESDLDALLVECGGAAAIAQLVFARVGFESSVSWGLREGTHIASVIAGAWRETMVAELPPMFAEAGPANDDHEAPAASAAELLEGWQRIAGACGASMTIVQCAPGAGALVAGASSQRPLELAMRYALEGTRAVEAHRDAPFPPFDDGFVARIETRRRGPAGLVQLGHAATNVALDARANGYAFASGPLERAAETASIAIALGRARRAGDARVSTSPFAA